MLMLGTSIMTDVLVIDEVPKYSSIFLSHVLVLHQSHESQNSWRFNVTLFDYFILENMNLCFHGIDK